jgi:hypothetical protein
VTCCGGWHGACNSIARYSCGALCFGHCPVSRGALPCPGPLILRVRSRMRLYQAAEGTPLCQGSERSVFASRALLRRRRASATSNGSNDGSGITWLNVPGVRSACGGSVRRGLSRIRCPIVSAPNVLRRCLNSHEGAVSVTMVVCCRAGENVSYTSDPGSSPGVDMCSWPPCTLL